MWPLRPAITDLFFWGGGLSLFRVFCLRVEDYGRPLGRLELFSAWQVAISWALRFNVAFKRLSGSGVCVGLLGTTCLLVGLLP